MVDRTEVHDHPDVRRAAAQVREAFWRTRETQDPGADFRLRRPAHGAARAAGQAGGTS